MPLNVRQLLCSLTFVIAGISAAGAQTPPVEQSTPIPQPAATPQPSPQLTSGDLLRARISKAKAFIAVRNYSAAAYELENVRRESADPAIRSGVNVLLMNSYLEQGDYKRAQDLLKELFGEQKTTKEGAKAAYLAAAGQIVKGARSRLERYQTLGLSVRDRTLPLEAVNDLERMRETLELVITESKELAAQDSRSSDAIAILEEAANSRSMLARDDYDSKRWRDEVADTREVLANSRTVVVSAINGMPSVTESDGKPVASTTPAAAPPVSTAKPSEDKQIALKPVEPTPQRPSSSRPREITNVPADPASQTAKASTPNAEKPPEQEAPKPASQPDSTANTTAKQKPKTDATPLSVGSLADFATSRATPVYPAYARNAHAQGVVRVEVIVDETGEVASIEKTSGPSLLQAAAKDAIKKWRFKPFERDGQPVKASGFVNFNFSL